MRLDEKLNGHSGVYFDGTLIESRQTPHQLIEIFDTPDLGRLMRIDGANMVSERDEFFYHESLVHPAAIAHGSPARALVIGGGDGGAVEELLKYPSIERVVLAELDGSVIELARKHFQSIHHGAFDDARVVIWLGDGMTYLRECGESWDLIYLDVTDPSGPSEALYARPFFDDCRRALNPGGGMVLHIGSPFSHPARVKSTMDILRAVFSTVTAYFVHVPAYGATWGFAVASNHLDPSRMKAAGVDAALSLRQIGDRQFYNGAAHEAMLARPEYIRTLLAIP